MIKRYFKITNNSKFILKSIKNTENICPVEYMHVCGVCNEMNKAHFFGINSLPYGYFSVQILSGVCLDFV